MASRGEITVKVRWWPLLLADGGEAFLTRLQAGSRVVWHLNAGAERIGVTVPRARPRAVR